MVEWIGDTRINNVSLSMTTNTTRVNTWNGYDHGCVIPLGEALGEARELLAKALAEIDAAIDAGGE